MGEGDGLTDREVQRAIERLDRRLDARSVVTPEVFAAEIRVQGEIHEQHRKSLEQLNTTIENYKKDLENDVRDLRGWMKWLFTLLATNSVALLGLIVTAIVALL